MMKQSRSNTRGACDALALGDTWQGLELDHVEVLNVVNSLRAWFNYNARKWNHGQVGGNAFVIAGHYGTGKSHIARVVQEIVSRHCVFWEEPDLLSALWDSYRSNNKTSERRIYQQARHAPLLIIDDLGAGHVNSAAWLQSLYWNIFSYHPLKGRGGILITTNLRWKNDGGMPFARRVGNRALTRLMHQLDGHNPETGRPKNWHAMWGARDRRFDYAGIMETEEQLQLEF